MPVFAVEFAGCVWTAREAVSGRKKLRTQKYPDTLMWTEPKTR